MKPYAFLSLIVAVTGFIAVVTTIEAPRKPRQGDETIHVLPRVEEMPTNPTPFSF
jgi:hypothetical protein